MKLLKNVFNIPTILTILSVISVKDVAAFYCTESFCDVRTSEYQYPCPDIVQNCTKIGYRTFLDPDVCNCCEYCFDYLLENDTCTTQSPQKPFEMCGPHLKCILADRETHATCQKIISAPENYPNPEQFCMNVRHEYEKNKEEGTLGIAQMDPECNAGGNYAPRQCLPGSICYCSNSEGERIFGASLPENYQDCACARDVATLQKFGFTGRLPHCLPNGDYDELQCVVRTCYCRSHPDVKFAMHAMNESKCYNPDIHIFDPEIPRYYMRDCELRRARVEVQIAEAELKGTTVIVADVPKCDPDGNYAAIQSDFQRLYCANPNGGGQIETFEADKFTESATKMNCYCARARLLLVNTATGKPKCCKNGNYRPWQCIGSTCFCVDSLGRQDLSLDVIQVHEDDIDLLSCYPKSLEPGDGQEPPCWEDRIDA